MEFLSKLDVKDLFVVLSAISAFAAAVAAWLSFNVSRDSFTFQKKLASNQVVSVQLNNTLSLLINIKLVLSDVFNSQDSEFKRIESTFEELQKQIKSLSCQTQLPQELLKLKNKTTVAQFPENEIDAAIIAIRRIIEELWK